MVQMVLLAAMLVSAVGGALAMLVRPHNDNLRAREGFAAVALDQRADFLFLGRFGFRSGRDFDKFQDISFAQDNAGMPYPLQAACAHYSCKVEQTVDLGTHMVFIGLAEESEILSEEEPLTYAYYRNVIKGKTPKNAPSYQKDN